MTAGRLRKLNQSNAMPNFSSTLDGWSSDLSLIQINTAIVNHKAVNTEVLKGFEGVVQPLKPNELMLKPEAQRSWKWLQIHIYSGFMLQAGDKIIYKGKKHRIMADKDYSQSGFMEYHCVEDYLIRGS